MGTIDRRTLVKQVVLRARENNIGTVMFHQAVGDVLGVNVTDMKCLDIITLKGSTSPSQLSGLTGLSSGSTTAMIDRLEKRGLVQRRPNPKDRRGTVIVLTSKASNILPPLFESLARAMEALVSSYSERELGVLSNYFRRAGDLWKSEREQLLSRFGKE